MRTQKKHTQRGRETDRQVDRPTGRERERERGGERERGRERERQTEKERDNSLIVRPPAHYIRSEHSGSWNSHGSNGGLKFSSV